MKDMLPLNQKVNQTKRHHMKRFLPAFTMLFFILFTGCKSLQDQATSMLFSPSQDKELGKQVKTEIASKPAEYPVLSKAQYPKAYQYLNDMKNNILASGTVEFKDEFDWELFIIQDDQTLNAFCTPGGYIYVYTGLIKYLEKADDLAGVMGHEIAHADRRHSIKQLQSQYGISILTSIVLGESAGDLAQIAGQLAGNGALLKFSRVHETEADEFSVRYLSGSPYACNGAASFFQKLLDKGQSGSTPEFMSTHPSPTNRVEDINNTAKAMGCSTNSISETGMTYAQFVASLP